MKWGGRVGARQDMESEDKTQQKKEEKVQSGRWDSYGTSKRKD